MTQTVQYKCLKYTNTTTNSPDVVDCARQRGTISTFVLMLKYQLINPQLFHQVRVDTVTVYKPHDHLFHPLLFKGIRNIVEQVLVWYTVQSLCRKTSQLKFME